MVLCLLAGCRTMRAVQQGQYQQDSTFQSGKVVVPEVDSIIPVQNELDRDSMALSDTLAFVNPPHAGDTLLAVNIDSAFVEEMHAMLSDSLSPSSMSNRSLGTKQPKVPAFTTKILRNSL